MKYTIISWILNLMYAVVHLVAIGIALLMLGLDFASKSDHVIGIFIIMGMFLLAILINYKIVKLFNKQNIEYNKKIYWSGNILLILSPYLFIMMGHILNQ